ncbi:TR19L factor, partial [Campylorhamphus procurvoides]|nr:TR19L factor [Campylorhamphus procurvoides]
CQACPPGTFSLGDTRCATHTQCQAGNRILVAPGTAWSDSQFYSPGGQRDPRGRCLPCPAAPRSTPQCPGRRRVRSPETPGQALGTNGTRVTPNGGEEEEEAAAAQAAVLILVPVFCAMGLLGILVCNLLKKKGYHCTASKDSQPGGTEGGGGDMGQTPVSPLVCPPPENAAALEELLREHRSQQLLPPSRAPLSKLQVLAQFSPSCQHQQHPHTVQGAAPCARCTQKWPQVMPTRVPRPAEVTILSVGRFRVSRIPELRSEAGAEPLRGPLPGSRMRPPGLRGTDGPPE